MTLPIRHTSLSLALLAFTAACHSAAPTPAAAQTGAAPPPAPVTDAERALAPRQYAQIRHMASLGKHCDWLGPTEMTAVSASAEERLAWIVWQGLDRDAAQAEADKLVAQTAAIDCNAAEAQQLSKGLRYGAWQMRSSWALRGESMLAGSGRPGWFAGKTALDEYAPLLEEVVAVLIEINAESAGASKAMFAEQAQQTLAVRCTPSDRDCPADGIEPSYRAYAEAVIEQTEAYALALAKSDDKIGRPPETDAP